MRRWRLATGYVISTLIVTFAVSIFVMGIGQIWALVEGQPIMTADQFLQCGEAILVSSLVFSALNTLIVTFTASQGSFTGYSIIMGTAMGFVSYCYVPPAILTKAMTNALNVLPFAQGASLIRRPVMAPSIVDVISVVPEGPLRDEARATLLRNLSTQLSVGGHQLTTGLIVVTQIALTIVLAVAVSWRFGRVIR
jgi:multidrug/hemolysin transport system permease protein